MVYKMQGNKGRMIRENEIVLYLARHTLQDNAFVHACAKYIGLTPLLPSNPIYLVGLIVFFFYS